MDHATGSDFGDLCDFLEVIIVGLIVYKIVRSVCADIENGHPIRSVGLIVVHWVIPVHVLAGRLAIIDGVGCIIWPESVNKIVLILEVCTASSLSKTIQRGTIALVGYEDTRVHHKFILNYKSDGV